MSEARNQRFEIDIDEIERQLRRSVEQPVQPKADPLAELARIVGQNDPFQGLLSDTRPERTTPRVGAANANHGPLPGPEASHIPPDQAPRPTAGPMTAPADTYDDMRPSAGPQGPELSERYDPVAEAYGSQAAALADERAQPLRRRPARGKLVAIAAALVVTVGAVAAGMSMRNSGGFLAGNRPPIIVADKSPLKVAPENPGGVEVPNQDRQIYSKGQPDGQSRMVDGREQPVDVRSATPAVSARAPVTERSPVNDALGEPRRVRTVAVNPDGTAYGAARPAIPAARTQDLMPAGGMPAPVPVKTVAVPAQAAAAPAAAPAPAAPAVAEAPAPVASTHQAVSVLPPARPNFDRPPSGDASIRTASINPAAPAPKPAAEAAAAARTEKPAAAAAPGGKNYSVQIAVRPSEQEARKAWDQAQEKFGSTLDSRPARLTSATVAGKTVHRVRLGPMTKPEADAMCGKLKAKGGACFVAVN